MPAEGVVPEAEVITEATSQPTETAAPGVTEDVCGDALPETSLDVVVRSLEIQDAELIRSVPMSEAAVTSHDGLELLAEDLINPATVARNLESKRRAEQRMEELEEAALPIARLLVPHPSGPKIAPLVDRLKEAPERLATYVKHLAKSIPNQVLAFMKSYVPKDQVDVVAGGLAANCTYELYTELLEQMAPIEEQVAEKLNLQ
jgi:uncharacterized membrane protein